MTTHTISWVDFHTDATNSLGRIWQRIAFWMARAEQRRQLAGLDDARLRDIGITREQALHAASKPFWR